MLIGSELLAGDHRLLTFDRELPPSSQSRNSAPSRSPPAKRTTVLPSYLGEMSARTEGVVFAHSSRSLCSGTMYPSGIISASAAANRTIPSAFGILTFQRKLNCLDNAVDVVHDLVIPKADDFIA